MNSVWLLHLVNTSVLKAEFTRTVSVPLCIHGDDVCTADLIIIIINIHPLGGLNKSNE